MAEASPRPVRVAILAFPEVTASVLYGLYDILLSAGRDWGLVVDGRPGASADAASGGVTVPRAVRHCKRRADLRRSRRSMSARRRMSSACRRSRSRRGAPIAGFGAEVEWLKRCHAQGATIATACSGAMLLALTGLLDDNDATTHWAYCDVMRSRHPRVRVHPQRALVVSGEGQRLVMAGGGTTWLDLAIYLISRFVALEVAMQTARLNLIEWHDIGQQPFARLARSRQAEDAEIARCQTWIAHHYNEPAPVAAMVRLSGLPERSFKRRFQQATGMSPLEYVHTLRLEEAKQMLESSD